MGRKVFISFLGADYYEACKYGFDGTTNIDYTTNESTPFIQEALLEYLYSDTNPDKWKNDEEHKVCILCTDDAISYNWLANKKFKDLPKGQKQYTEDDGLKARLHKQNIKCEECGKDGDPCYIEDNKDNMWKIFAKLDGLVDNDDELYLDVTHGFRYMPMMMLVFANYVKFTKKVTIKHIFYGDKGNKNIIDLLPLSNLQDWTYATATYLENGNANSLIKLAKEEGKNDFAKALKDVMLDFQTCRSIPIVKGTHFKELNDKLPNFGSDESKQPFNNLVRQIRKEISGFKHDASSTIDDENVNNGYKAAIWCFNNQLYQQAITILKENLITERIVTEEPHRDWRNGYGHNRTDTINEVKNYLKDRYIKQQLDKEHQKPLLDLVRETCKRKGVQHTIPCLVKDINKLTFDNHELNFCYYSSFDDSEIDFINETIIQQINKQKTTNNKYEHDIDMWDGNRSNEFHLLNSSGKDVITNEDRENVSRKLIIEKSYEKSDRKQVSSITINGISEPRNDFNHAGFAFGSSTEFPDGWSNTKIIEEVKKAFVELINLKFAGKYEMTEKNGFPYIKEK